MHSTSRNIIKTKEKKETGSPGANVVFWNRFSGHPVVVEPKRLLLTIETEMNQRLVQRRAEFSSFFKNTHCPIALCTRLK